MVPKRARVEPNPAGSARGRVEVVARANRTSTPRSKRPQKPSANPSSSSTTRWHRSLGGHRHSSGHPIRRGTVSMGDLDVVPASTPARGAPRATIHVPKAHDARNLRSRVCCRAIPRHRDQAPLTLKLAVAPIPSGVCLGAWPPPTRPERPDREDCSRGERRDAPILERCGGQGMGRLGS
jgi:hypothetical protein